MSAPVDSLNIKVDASARSANQQLDKLVQKMVQLRSTVNGINIGNLNKMAAGIQNFSKAVTGLNQVKTSDFTRMAKNIEKLTNVNSSNLDKSAQSVEKAANSLQKASSVSKKAISSGLKFDASGAQDMQKAIQSLSNEYANVGKGKTFEGTLLELEKQADKLGKKLDDLAEKEEKILTVGGTSTESKAFKNLQYDISKTMNQLAELENEIARVRSAEKQDISSLPIFRYDSPSIGSTENSGLAEFKQKADSVFKEIPESAKYSVEAAQQSLQSAMQEVHIGNSENSGFRNYTEEIKNLEANLKSLEQSGKGIGSDEWDEAYIALHKVNMEVEDYKANLLRPWKEGDAETQKTDSLGNRVEELNAKLKELKANGLNFGDADFDDVYRSLQRATGELKEYKAILNKPATGIDEEIKKTDSLGNRVEQLKTKLKDLQSKGLNFGDPKFDSTYRELQKSTGELKKYKSSLVDTGNITKSVASKITDAFRSIWSQTKKAGSGVVSFGSKIKNLTTRFHSMSSSTNGLIGKIMKLYIGFQSLRGVGNFLKDSVESSMDYIEEYNYFNTTMEKIASEWNKDYKKYGYKNADEYGKSFQGRLTEVMNKMTGFQMNDDGTLTDSQNKNLGLDVTQMTNYAAGIAQVTNSVGLTGEASTVTSKALSMLAGDMSSFRNLDMKTVMNNFSSGLIGQSRALYKYGIDITNATLATYAHDMGIKKNITDMTQAEKMQLRMIAILDQSKVAWGDLAKTINSPSNQLRLLQNNFKSLSRTIGNMFLPVVAKVLPYVNGLVIAIRRLFEWTASMLGIKLDDVIGNSGGGYSDMFDGIEEDADNASDAVDDTTDSVKKLAKQLMGFDELNVITTNQNSSNNSDKGDSAPIDLTSQLSSALADYEKVWNDAYENMTSDAEKFANKLTKLFKDAWTSGDGSDIGSAIAKWLNKGINWVNNHTEQFSNGLNKIAGMLGTTLNGFVNDFDWPGLGTAVGNSIKAALEAEEKFFDTVNWVNLGSSLATSLNTAIDTGVIKQYFTTMASKIRGAIEFAFGAITTFKFDNLGSAIGQGINDFFEKMGQVNKETGLNGWETLGQTLTEGISGIADTLITAIDTVEWEEVGKAIKDFVVSIDGDKIKWKFKKLIGSLSDAISDTIEGATGITVSPNLVEITLEFGIVNWLIKKPTGTSLITRISNSIKSVLETAGLLKAGELTVTVGGISNLVARLTAYLSITMPSPVTDNIIRNIDETITRFLEKTPGYDKNLGIFSLPKQLLIDFPIALGNLSITGWDMLTENLRKDASNHTEDIRGAVSLMIADIFSGDFKFRIPFTGVSLPSYNEWTKSLSEWWSNVKDWFKDKVVFIVAKVGDIAASIKEKWEKAKEFAKSKIKLPDIKVPKIGDIKTGVASAWKKAKSWWNSNVKLPAIKFVDIAKDTIKKWLKPVVDFANGLIEKINKLLKIEWKDIKVAGKTIISGGSFTIATIPKITGFATGGFPQQGQYFLARENGPELVGTIGGRTAVANNAQIVQSVSDGVFNALAPVLTQVINSVNALNSKIDNMGGSGVDVEKYTEGDLLKVVRKEDSSYRKRTGKSAFAY